MFKIVKNRIHRRGLTTRKGLFLKRASLAHQILLDLISCFKENPKKNAVLLKIFFEDEVQKTCIKKWVNKENHSAFDTAWEGAYSLLRASERETNLLIKKADMELLYDDLAKLKEFLLTLSAC